MFEPSALAQVFKDHDIAAVPVISEEPDLEPHTIELPLGLAVEIHVDHCQLMQEKNGVFLDHGEFTRLSPVIGLVKEKLEEDAA